MLYDGRHNDVRRDTLTITADDGRALHATWYEPIGVARVGVVVVAPAMATPSSYYAAFATWLATQGYRTLAFDVRGMDSVAAMKAEDADLLRWFGDMASALDVALGSAGDLPVTYVGHSLGGQAIPFVDHSRVDRIITVASGTGYYRHSLGDVPSGVMRQWGRWCMHPDAMGADVPNVAERFASVTSPITSITFTDDQ